MTTKSKKIFLFSIIGGLVVLFSSLYFLNYLKVKSGISIYGFENVTGLQKIEKGDFLGAIEEYNKAITREPNKSALFYNRGIAYEKSHDFIKAIEDFRQSLKINNYNDHSKYVGTYFELANCYIALNELDSSLKYYLKTNELKPNDNLVILNIAYVFDLKGDTNNVCKYLKTIKNLEPKYQETFNEMNEKCK